MEQHQIRRLPVIDDHRLVGMISEADLAHPPGGTQGSPIHGPDLLDTAGLVASRRLSVALPVTGETGDR
ncbi:CBS domain-containing protein [Micromonospora olivasterospora]